MEPFINPPYQPPTNQPLVNQALPPVSQIQGVSKTDFDNYVKANDAVLKNVQNQGQNLQNQMANVTSLLTSLCHNFKNCRYFESGIFQVNTAITPREQINVITQKRKTFPSTAQKLFIDLYERRKKPLTFKSYGGKRKELVYSYCEKSEPYPDDGGNDREESSFMGQGDTNDVLANNTLGCLPLLSEIGGVADWYQSTGYRELVEIKEDPKEDQGMDFEDDDEVKEWEDDEDGLMVPVTPPRAASPVRSDIPPLSLATSTLLPIESIMLRDYQATTTIPTPWLPPTLRVTLDRVEGIQIGLRRSKREVDRDIRWLEERHDVIQDRTLMRGRCRLHKKFYNSLGSVPNCCSVV
ncbi:hypothetical protein Tco_1439457 [Tanacetum coccineum]